MGKTLLLVDDESIMRRVYSIALTKLGFNVLTANNGFEAIVEAEDKSPDLILMDIEMPEMDGIDAVRRIKANPATKHIPILMLTAHSSKEIILECLEAGAVDYLVKADAKMNQIQGKIAKAIKCPT